MLKNIQNFGLAVIRAIPTTALTTVVVLLSLGSLALNIALLGGYIAFTQELQRPFPGPSQEELMMRERRKLEPDKLAAEYDRGRRDEAEAIFRGTSEFTMQEGNDGHVTMFRKIGAFQVDDPLDLVLLDDEEPESKPRK